MKQKSIITNDFNKCYLCGSHSCIEVHHIFNADNRKNSTKYGLVVPLCHYCHNEPPNGVHHNKKRMDYLKRIGQQKFQEFYKDLDFITIFRKNYL